jgi:hypothetical protein
MLNHFFLIIKLCKLQLHQNVVFIWFYTRRHTGGASVHVAGNLLQLVEEFNELDIVLNEINGTLFCFQLIKIKKYRFQVKTQLKSSRNELKISVRPTNGRSYLTVDILANDGYPFLRRFGVPYPPTSLPPLPHVLL